MFHLRHCRCVLFCSLAVLDPRVGHTMDVLSPFISVILTDSSTESPVHVLMLSMSVHHQTPRYWYRDTSRGGIAKHLVVTRRISARRTAEPTPPSRRISTPPVCGSIATLQGASPAGAEDRLRSGTEPEAGERPRYRRFITSIPSSRTVDYRVATIKPACWLATPLPLNPNLLHGFCTDGG